MRVFSELSSFKGSGLPLRSWTTVKICYRHDQRKDRASLNVRGGRTGASMAERPSTRADGSDVKYVCSVKKSMSATVEALFLASDGIRTFNWQRSLFGREPKHRIKERSRYSYPKIRSWKWLLQNQCSRSRAINR